MRESALVNNDNFLIEEKDLDFAKNICKSLPEDSVRCRAVANVLAASVAKKYFTELEVDTETGLHNIDLVLNNFDISDIYVKDSYIDVRIYFEENELCVPKVHFEKELLPLVYMFVKVSSELSEATVTGFILPSDIDQSNVKDGYIGVLESQLVSYYDVEPLFVESYEDDFPEDFEVLMFDYLDGILKDDKEFFKILISSRYCRNALKSAVNAQEVLANVEELGENVANVVDEKLDTTSEKEEVSFVLEEEPDLFEDAVLEEPIEQVEDLDEFGVETESSVLLDEAIEELDGVVETVELETFEDDLSMVEQDGFEDDIVDLADETIIDSEDISEEILPGIQQDYSEATSDEYEILPSFETEKEEIVPIQEYSGVSEENIEDENLYSTNVTPSLEVVEEFLNDEGSEDEDLEALLDSDKSVFDKDIESEETLSDADYVADESGEKELEVVPEEVVENNPQIDELFAEDVESTERLEEDLAEQPARKTPKALPVLGVLTLLAALGYFGYTKYFNVSQELPKTPEPLKTTVKQQDLIKEQDVKDKLLAMPLETVEDVKTQQTTNEGNAISIPAIEQNLDASIAVSNLSVNWEVPAGYVSNNTAKRYFTKIGKIIQLNLKTELLLLSKPPITNKIVLELEYNKTQNKFDVKDVTTSSGEKAIDDLIIQTVNKVLGINLKMNMSAFSSIAGNPVLVIRL